MAKLTTLTIILTICSTSVLAATTIVPHNIKTRSPDKAGMLDVSLSAFKIGTNSYIYNGNNGGGNECYTYGTNYNCTVSTTNLQYQVSVVPLGNSSDKPFNDVASNESKCSLNIIVGNTDSFYRAYGGALSTYSNMQRGSGSALYNNGSLKTIDKRCRDVTVADIGLISTSYSGWQFNGPLAAASNPEPMSWKKYSVWLAAYPGSSALGQPGATLSKITDVTGGEVKPTPVTCNLNGSLILNHGTVSSSELINNTQESDLSLQCSNTASVKITFLGVGETGINLGGGIYSTLSLPSGDSLIVNGTTPSYFKVQSKLNKDTGIVTAGYYTATAVMSLSFN